ncbi:hypothetical protein LTR53_014517 [Teratosphaeriaceae sp. CCFEE 6253]|nr:hypothetical protein LTR53_014517 [Teratosphaeriaceae sp. CCFEE 6253]
MPVRRATQDDFLPMSKLAAQAFFDDELFGDVIHPHRDRYPEDTYLYWLARLRQNWGDPNQHFFISTVDGHDEEIAGWAQFLRKSASAKKDTAQPGISDLPLNRAADEEREDILERQYSYIAHEWSGPRAECWDIIWLCTSPAHQGQGHGRKLVKWVVEQAEREQVPSSVISAKGKDGFYNKQGYTIPTGTAFQPEANPLWGLVEGGQFWWKEDHLKR